MYQYADRQIRVHAFDSELALMPVGVLRQRLSRARIDLPTHALLDRLSKMLETVVVYPAAHAPAPPLVAIRLSRLDVPKTAIDTGV